MKYNEFRKSEFKKLTFRVIFCVVALIFSFYLGISSGNGKIDFSTILNLFSDGKDGIILSQIRLPRTLGAIFGGMLLGISGCLMQGILRNPLASPYTLGIAQAAAFGASFAIIILGVLESSANYGGLGVVGCAFASSAICAVAILYFGKIKSMSSFSLILAGVALGALFGAASMLLQFFASDLNAAAALFWTFGDLGKANSYNLVVLAISSVAIFGISWINYWKIDALELGEESAKSRGVSVKSLRIIVFSLATFAAAVVVSYFGIIGFVGLIAPHLVRLSVGRSYAILIPFSGLYGAILLTLADVASKFIIPPVIIPIGIVTSFAGVFLFLYLLARKNDV